MGCGWTRIGSSEVSLISLFFMKSVHLAGDDADQILEAGFLQMRDGLYLLCRLDLTPDHAAVCFQRRSRAVAGRRKQRSESRRSSDVGKSKTLPQGVSSGNHRVRHFNKAIAARSEGNLGRRNRNFGQESDHGAHADRVAKEAEHGRVIGRVAHIEDGVAFGFHVNPMAGASWRVDETYVKIKVRWTYLYRAVDKQRKTVERQNRRQHPPRRIGVAKVLPYRFWISDVL